MRICLYTETALPQVGGQEIVVDTLARTYQILGHDVVVLAIEAQPRHPQRAVGRGRDSRPVILPVLMPDGLAGNGRSPRSQSRSQEEDGISHDFSSQNTMIYACAN